MSRRIDWFPQNKELRHAIANKTVQYLLLPGVRERFGFGPAPSLLPSLAPSPFGRGGVTPELLAAVLTQGDWLDLVFMPTFNMYNTAYGAWLNTAERTQVKIQVFKDAEDIFIPLYRKLYIFIKGHPLATNADLTGMGFPVLQRTRTPVSVPTSHPVAEALHPSSGVVVINFRDSESKKGRKPAGVHGAEIAWAILGEAPRYDEWDKLAHSGFDTSSPFTFTFTGSGGKNLYFALRWENTRGEKGPWSDIRQTVIS